MRKVVVFGATGKVGCYTALYLKEMGYDVTAVGRRASDNGFFADHGIPYVSLDILRQEDFRKLPQEDVYGVIHMAAILPATMKGYDPHEYVRTNLDGTLNVLDYSVKAGVQRFVFPKSWSDILNSKEDVVLRLTDAQRNMLAVRMAGSIIKQFAQDAREVNLIGQYEDIFR